MPDTRHEYDRLAAVYAPVAAVVLVLVVLAVAWCLWRYRERPSAAPRRARPDAAPRAEGLYVAVLVLVAAALITMTFRVESRTDAVAARPALRVDVVAARWSWRFTYPGTGVARGPDAQGRTVVVVPAGRTIAFAGTARDVIHAFWVPDVRFQRQLFPGHVERFDLVFRRPGTYQGVCSMFCGLYHQNMHFDVRALPPAAFWRWLAAARAGRPA